MTNNITSIIDLDKINDFVHDRTIVLSEIDYDEEVGVILIPLTVFLEDTQSLEEIFWGYRWKIHEYKALLRILNVKRLEVHDKAEIDQACINTINFVDSMIKITSSVPASISISISKFDLSLEIKNEVVSIKKRFSILKKPKF